MAAYYNEFKPEAAHMLRQLIKDNLIAPGDVDERSVLDVHADDLTGYTQCHFFAGIGGWSVALRQAMWSDDRPVWTGSCPCQGHSTAGKQKGASDPRHLWPHWFRLIRECRPSKVYGEQVANAITFGWLDEIANDMEVEDYAIAAAVLPACSVGKPHKRYRVWFVANSNGSGFDAITSNKQYSQEYHTESCGSVDDAAGERINRGPVAIISKIRRPSTANCGQFEQSSSIGNGNVGNTEYYGQSSAAEQGSEGQAICYDQEGQNCPSESTGTGSSDNVADSLCVRHEGNAICGEDFEKSGEFVPRREAGRDDNTQWIICPDGKARPIERGIPLLAHGVQHRAPILHGFGNAIVPQVAAEFIKATM